MFAIRNTLSNSGLITSYLFLTCDTNRKSLWAIHWTKLIFYKITKFKYNQYIQLNNINTSAASPDYLQTCSRGCLKCRWWSSEMGIEGIQGSLAHLVSRSTCDTTVIVDKSSYPLFVTEKLITSVRLSQAASQRWINIID